MKKMVRTVLNSVPLSFKSSMRWKDLALPTLTRSRKASRYKTLTKGMTCISMRLRILASVVWAGQTTAEVSAVSLMPSSSLSLREVRAGGVSAMMPSSGRADFFSSMVDMVVSVVSLGSRFEVLVAREEEGGNLRGPGDLRGVLQEREGEKSLRGRTQAKKRFTDLVGGEGGEQVEGADF